MNRDKDHEILSALLDGEASERELQRILAQAHDSDLLDQLHALQSLEDLKHAERADWAGIDLREGVQTRLAQAAPDQPAAGTLHTAETPVHTTPQGGAASGHTRSLKAGRFLWPQVAVAAGVMGVSLLLFESLPGLDQRTVSDQRISTMTGTAVISDVAEVPVSHGEVPAHSATPPDSPAYRAGVSDLLRFHTESVVTQSGDLPDLLRLSRLPSADVPPGGSDQ